MLNAAQEQEVFYAMTVHPMPSTKYVSAAGSQPATPPTPAFISQQQQAQAQVRAQAQAQAQVQAQAQAQAQAQLEQAQVQQQMLQQAQAQAQAQANAQPRGYAFGTPATVEPKESAGFASPNRQNLHNSVGKQFLAGDSLKSGQSLAQNSLQAGGSSLASGSMNIDNMTFNSSLGGGSLGGISDLGDLSGYGLPSVDQSQGDEPRETSNRQSGAGDMTARTIDSASQASWPGSLPEIDNGQKGPSLFPSTLPDFEIDDMMKAPGMIINPDDKMIS